MYRISLWLIGLLVLSLAACTKTISVPTPLTEPDPFSTLDFATPQEDSGNGLVVNGSDLYVMGHTKGSLDGINLGATDGFLRRYSSDGLKLWGVQFGTGSSDIALKVAMDSNGDVYVLGHTLGPLGFKIKDFDVFLAKFNQDGERVWIRQFGTKNVDRPTGLAIDSNNRIYVLSDEGVNNFVIRKFDMGGNLLKTKSFTLNNRPDLEPRAIAVDSSNRVIALTDWDNSGNSLGRDVRLFKYNSNLNQIWQNNYGTSDDEFAFDITTDSGNEIYFTLQRSTLGQGGGGHFVKKNTNGGTVYTRRLEYSPTSQDTLPRSITTDSNDNIYIAGDTQGSFPSFSNAGFRDIVVFKYNNSGNQQWVTQFGDGNYGSASNDSPYDIAINDAVYITGDTSGNLLKGNGASYGGSDAYIAKLSKSNGTILGVDQ